MKKLLCFLLCLCLIFSSVSLSFAAEWSATDSNNLAAIKNALTSGASTIYGWVSSINSKLTFSNKSIANIAQDINDRLNNTLYLSDGGTNKSITWWVKEALLDLDKLVNGFSYLDGNGNTKFWLPDIYQELYGTHQELIFGLNKTRQLRALWGDGYYRNSNFSAGNNYLYNIYYVLEFYGNQLAQGFQNLEADYKVSQTFTQWDDITSTGSFTPVSVADGLYKWLSYIQAPTSRLSYVLASDERIAAQEAAADNEEAVVDNFIDSSGSGAASTSDISSVSDLSSGYKQNFGSNATITGIFDIFNSDHMGWFSQETKNQLDTTSSRSKSGESDTPLLDKQIQEIYDGLGVKMP